MVEQLNAIARLWWAWSAGMFWQVGLLILLIAAVDRLIRRWAWPQLRYELWSLILVKLLLPPSLSLPSGIVPGLEPVVRQVLSGLESETTPAAESHALFSSNEDMHRAPAQAPLFTKVPAASDGNSEPVHSVPVSTYGETLYGVTTNEFLSRGEEPSSSVSLVWQVYAMIASLAGTLILGIWLFFRLYSLVGRHAQETAAASLPQSFYNQLADCARRLELRRVPRVIVTDRLATPAVFGIFRPVLLMPGRYLSTLSQRDIEHVLLHELAHIKRGDLIVHGLYMLLQIVYWHNPLLWLVRRQMHHLRELSCDATVAELLRERTTAYRQTLLETARRLLTSSVEPGLGLLGLFEDSNHLAVRLNWLTKPTWRYKTMKRATVATIAALMLACVLPMAKADEAASRYEERDTTEQEIELSLQMAELQMRLDQLRSQQEELQRHLQVLAERRGRIMGRQPQAQAPAGLGGMGRPHVGRPQARGDQEADRISIEAQRWDLRAEQFRNWAQSEQVHEWRGDIEHWQNQVKKWVQAQRSGQAVDGMYGDEPLPPMPALPPMSRGLAGYWKLDAAEGTFAMDSSGYGRHGALHGSPVWLPEGGRIGGALQFDGKKDYVDTGWSENLPTWTVAVWVKSPVPPRAAMPSGPVHRESNFQINWNHHTDEFRGAAALRVGQDWYSASFGPLRSNTWYHLAATYDGESLRAYRDGLLVAENTLPSGRPRPESKTLKFGRHAGEPVFFEGTIDEVYVFAEVLGPKEIEALYTQ